MPSIAGLPTLFVIFLCLLAVPPWCLTLAASPLCTIINHHTGRGSYGTQPAIVIDGLSGSAANGLWEYVGTWASATCATTNGGSPQSLSAADPDWQPSTLPQLAADFARRQGLSASNGRLRRTLDARVSADGQQLELLNITLQFRLDVTKSGVAGSADVVGVLSKTIVGVPLQAATYLPVGWYGSLQRRTGGLVLSDADLMDGVYPAVTVATGADIMQLLEVAETIRDVAGNAALRHVLFDTVPSALGEVTVRGAFLGTSALPSLSLNDASVGQVWTSTPAGDSSTAATGVILQSRGECWGASCSGQPFVTSLQKLVEASLSTGGDLCTSLTPVSSSLRASLSVDIGVMYSPSTPGDLTHALVRARGMSARSEGVFQCTTTSSGPAYIGVVLAVTAPLNESAPSWPLHALTTNQRITAGLIQAIPLRVSGKMSGRIVAGSLLYTIAQSDLFDARGGGRLLSDHPLPPLANLKSTITSLFTNIRSRLTTAISPIDASIARTFPNDSASVDQLLADYTAQRSQPSFLDFLHFWSSVNGADQLQLLVNDDERMVISVEQALIRTPLSSSFNNALLLSRANSALQNLANALKSRFSSAGSYSIPSIPTTLANVDLANSYVSGFLSALISLNISAVLANDMASAFSVPSTPQVMAMASIRGSFVGSNLIFSSADITYDFNQTLNGGSALIRATLASGLRSSIGGMAGMSLDGNLAIDGTWANPSSLVSSYLSVANSIGEVRWARQILQPFTNIDLGRMSNRARLADIATTLASIPATTSTQTTTGWTYAEAVRQAILSFSVDDPAIAVYAHVVPIVSPTNVQNQALDVTIVVHSLRRAQIGSTGTTWDSSIDTNRLGVPLALTTRLRFSVGPTNSPLSMFIVQGGGSLQGWTLPFTWRMLSGPASGTASITINLPSGSPAADLLLSMEVATNRLPLTAKITGNLVDESEPAILAVTQRGSNADASMGTPTITASRVLSAIGEAVLPALPQAFSNSLNIQVPPLKKTLGAISSQHFTQFIGSVKPWLGTLPNSASATAILVESDTFCVGSPAAVVTLNIAVNDQDMRQCASSAALAPASVDDLRANIQNVLSSCDLSEWLAVQVVDTYMASGQQCGHVGIYPAVPGIIYNFAVTTDASSGNVSLEAQWASNPKPIFATWPDLSALLTTVMGQPSGESTEDAWRWTTVDASLVVPAQLSDYFPPELPAMAVRLHASQKSIDQQLELEARISAEGGSVQLRADVEFGIGSVGAEVSGTMVTVFGGPPMGGLGNISLSSNFDGVSTTVNETLVPPAPNNTFALVIGAELVSKSAVGQPQWIGTTQTIVLTPGKLLSRALIEDVVQQLDAIFRPMVAIYEVPADGFINPITQIRFDLIPQQSDQQWLLPASFGFRVTSGLPAIKNAANVPMQSFIFMQGLTMSLDADVEAAQFDTRGRLRTTTSAEGRVGILGFQSASHQARSSIKVFVQGLSSYQALAQLYSSRDQFFQQFAVNLALNNSAQVSGIQMTDVQNVATDLPNIVFTQAKQLVIRGIDELRNLTNRELNDWRALFNGTAQAVQTFRSLVKTNNTICTWMGLTNNISQAIVTSAVASKKIPFSKNTFGSLLSDSLVTSIKDIHTAVCVNGESLSLFSYCRTVSKGFFGSNTTGCANASLSAAGVTVDLVVTPFNRSYADQLELDTGSLFGDNLPVGIGATGDLSMMGRFDFKMRLQALFKNGSITLRLDPEGTYFMAQAAFDARGTLRFYFGSISLNLVTAHAWLGHPAAFVVRLLPPSNSSTLALTYEEDASTALAVPEITTTYGYSALATQQGRVSITGNAGFVGVIGFDPTVQCTLNVSIPDLQAFLTGTKARVNQTGCGKGFAKELLKKLLNSSLLEFFSTRFLAQWESGFANFLSRLFGKGGQLRGGAAVLPLIGRLLSAVVIDSIGSMNGADTMKRLNSAINEVTTTVLAMNITDNQQIMDQIVLNLFTDALCRELQKTKVLPECPPAPNATDSEYVWPLHFRGNKSRSLGDLGFSLGSKRFASLELKCSGALEMDWDLVLVMAFNRTHGLSFRFETSPVFDADLSVKVSDGCGLVGTIGWIGADLMIQQPQLLAGHLTVNQTFFVDLSVKAQILGEAQLGLGGKLAERLAKSPGAIDALPHWQATLSLTWEWNIHTNRSLVPRFALTDVTFCIGRLLSNTITTTVAQTVDRFMQPLDPILGKDGLLLKPIPGLSDVFGSDLNVVQLLNFACKIEGHCELDGVVKTLETFLDIYYKLDLVRSITKALDGEGCNVVQLVSNFTVDFKKKHPAVEYTGNVTKGTLSWADPNDSPQLKETVTTFYRGMQKSGSFGIRLYIFDDLGQNLVNAMLGQDFAIAGVTLPDFVFFIGMEWHIPVFVFPRVDLVLGVNAQLAVRFGGVSLMYSGLAQAYKTKSPGAIFGALALPTKYDDGSERWPVQAAVGFKGGVSVSILIFKGEVYLTVTLEGDAAFVDVDGDGWVTFNELFYLVKRNGLAGSIKLRVQLKAGFGIKIQACINLIFKKKCWTLFDKKWEKAWPLFDNSRKIFDSIANEQTQVNLDMVSFDTGSGEALVASPDCETCVATLSHIKRAEDGTDLTYNIFETPDGLTVDFYPAGVGVSSGMPHLMRSNLPVTQSITATGNPGATPYTWSVGYVSQMVEFPNHATATLRFLVGQYSEVSDVDIMTITPQSVSPDTAPGVLVSSCAQVHLAEPTTGVTYAVTGVPCPALIEAMATNNVSLSGPVDLYTDRTVTLEGEAWVVSSTVPATQYTISSASLVGIDGPHSAEVMTPLTYRVLEVMGHPQRPSTYTIADVSSGVMASVTGGQDDDLFIVQGMHLLHGSTHLAGGAGVDMAEITIEVQPDLGDMEVTMAPTWLLVKNGMGGSSTLARRFADDLDDDLNNTHSLRHTSIERRTYYLKGATNTRAKVTMLPTDRDDSVIIVAQNAIGGTIAQQITGCDGKSEVRYRFEGGGTHELRIGNQQKVSDMRCTVWLDGTSDTDGQLVSVVVEATAEERPLQYDIQRNAILIYDVLGDGNFFHLMFDEVQRIHLQFGSGGSVLRMDEGTAGTEFFFEFPQNASVTNVARVTSTNHAVLFAGHLTEIDVGPVETPIYSVDPLNNLLAPVVLAQMPSSTGNPADSNTAALVRLASGTGPAAPAQHYYLNQECLAKRDFNTDGGRAPTYVQTVPTEWLCGLIVSYGLPSTACANPCPIVYNGPINVTITTGWADDTFYGVDSNAASVAVSLGPGADNVTWLRVQEGAANNYATARFDLGVGTDTLMLSAPMRNVTAMLGSDSDVDTITFFWSDLPLPPNVHGDMVKPIGPYDSSLNLRQVAKQDLLFIYGGSSPDLPTSTFSRPDITVNEVGRAEEWLSHYERQGDRPVITIDITVTSLVTMDAQSNVVYNFIGSSMQATVSLNGQGRPEPPHPSATDWDTVLDVTAASGLLVNVWALPQSRTTTIINVQGEAQDQLQAVSIASPDEICRTLYGKVEVRTSNVDHLKVASAARPIAVDVDGTANNDLVILTPNNPTETPSTVHLKQVQNTTLVTNAVLTVDPTALLANRTIVISGDRSQLAFTGGYNFGAGVSYLDGCLLGTNFKPPTVILSPWFTTELVAVSVDPSATQGCSIYTKQLASVDLATPTLSVRGLGAQQAVSKLNLHTETRVWLNETAGTVWTQALVNNGTLTVVNREFDVTLHAGGVLTVMSPVLDMANVSVVDIFSSPFNGPICVWYFGQPPKPFQNQTNEDRLSLQRSGVTLAIGDPRQLVEVHGGVLASPRHLPLLRIRGELNLFAVVHNATNATTRDITINSTLVQAYEIPTAAYNSTSALPSIDTAVTAAHFAVQWTDEIRKGFLNVDFNDGDNRIHLVMGAPGAARPQNPKLIVRKNASISFEPLSTQSDATSTVSLRQTTGLRVQLPGQFLRPLLTNDVFAAYCYEPSEQSDRNSWLWITTRQAPWLEPDLPCRLDDEVKNCEQNIVVDLQIDQDHRLLSDFSPPSPPIANASAGEEQLYLPYVLYITNNPGSYHWSDAPSEWDIGVAILVVSSVITVATFGWWIFTGSIAPTPLGPFIITAALAGLIRSSTTWHPRVVALVQAAHWMVATVVTTDRSSCAPFTPSIFHLCLMSAFLLTGLIILGLLFFHERIRFATIIRRAVIAIVLLAVPFIIIQTPAHEHIDSGWPVLTTFLSMCSAFVLLVFVLHTFAALPLMNRRILSLMPALLLVLVIVWMSIFIRLNDLDLLPRSVLYGAVIAAVVVDSAASLSAMVLRSSLVRSWWRISPGLITGVASVISTGCGLTFVCTLELEDGGSGGELWLVTWFLWALLPALASALIYLPLPSIDAKGKSKTSLGDSPGNDDPLGLSLHESKRPLLKDEESVGYKAPVIVPGHSINVDGVDADESRPL